MNDEIQSPDTTEMDGAGFAGVDTEGVTEAPLESVPETDVENNLLPVIKEGDVYVNSPTEVIIISEIRGSSVVCSLVSAGTKVTAKEVIHTEEFLIKLVERGHVKKLPFPIFEVFVALKEYSPAT